MRTTFWLVRHGPTHSTAANGWTDIAADLSDLEQVARTSSMIPTDAIVISSDLSRAVDTADAVGHGRERLDHHFDLREFNFGDWEGREFGEIAENDPEKSRHFWENPGDAAPPGGESFHDLQGRVSRVLHDLAKTHGERDICCVVHFGVILTAIAHASNMPASVATRFHIDNLSVTRIEYMHPTDSWIVRSVNHLP